MTPAARLQAAIDILGELEQTRQSADQYLRQWFRTRRFAGSKDRAAIGERVFTIMRHRNAFGWRMQDKTPRALVIGSLLAEGLDVPSLFTGGYGPPALSEEELHKIAQAPADAPPSHVTGEYPLFLESELQKAFGENLHEEMKAFQQRGTIDLRVNTLQSDKETVLRTLKENGLAAEAMPFAPQGLRIASGEGLSVLSRHALFEAGAFEFQDEAAQIASLLCDAGPGMRVLDLAAGAGGKSLSLAADMQNKGEIVAFDIDAARLARLDERKTRAGATIIRNIAEDISLVGDGFDLVLVDAPCSGTGTWRRQPESRWRLTPERLASYRQTQLALLEEGAARVRKGGRLVYATCSVLPSENAVQVRTFLARHTDFSRLPATTAWQAQSGAPLPPGIADFFEASPRKTGTDGFFAALLVRR